MNCATEHQERQKQYNIAFVSLGCAKNLVNTEQMMALVRQAGHKIVANPEDADVAVLNTCGFIDSAKSEAIDNILELGALKGETALQKLLVAGCLTQRYQQMVTDQLPEIDGLLGTGSYVKVVEAIDEVMAGGTPFYFGDIDHTEEEGDRIITTATHTAYLKIAEGCDNRCAFCVIPSLRGRYRSRPMEGILREAERLSKQGVQELIIIAQDITRYGMDNYKKRMLPTLLEELCKLPFHWIRLHYLYPDELDDTLIDVMAANDKILNYVDIPLQHINNKILKSMNRRSTKEEIVTLIDKLRDRLPGLVLRTSLICGLPGEGEEEFEELAEFLAETGIERAGIFQFSPEEGTKAAEMDNQVEPEVAARRVELLVDLQSRVMDDYNESCLGETMEILCEGFDADMGCFVGRSYGDSPDVDGKVYFTAAGLVMAGTFVPVTITGVQDGDLMGEVEE